jgi:hypothetical protein
MRKLSFDALEVLLLLAVAANVALCLTLTLT